MSHKRRSHKEAQETQEAQKNQLKASSTNTKHKVSFVPFVLSCASLWLLLWPIDTEIVERYFINVAGVEPDPAAAVVFTVLNRL